MVILLTGVRLAEAGLVVTLGAGGISTLEIFVLSTLLDGCRADFLGE